MNQLTSLIRGAIEGSANPQQQKAAEANLVRLREQDTMGFFTECSNILSNAGNNEFLRQSAATVLSRSAVTKSQNGAGNYYWMNVSVEQRMAIREKLLALLISPSKNVMRAGASALSQVAAIEIEQKNWLDLVDIMAENTRHSDPNIRMASIQTIGFLCQQLKRRGVAVNQRCCEQFLGAIIVGSRDNNPNIVQNSLTALQNSISFLSSLLNNSECRNEVMKILSQKIQSQDWNRACFEILFQYSKACYPYLGENLQFFVDLSMNVMPRRDDLTVLANQLWETVGTEYLERIEEAKGRVNQQSVSNHLVSVSQKIVPEIMKCMLINNNNDLDFVQMRESAIKALGTFCQSCGPKIIETITNGVSYTLNSQNPGERQATIPLFSALCDYQDKSFIEGYLKNGFEHMFKLLGDSQPIVVKNSLGGFVRIFQQFSASIVLHQNITAIVDTLYTLGESSKDVDIVNSCFQALGNLTEGLPKIKGNKICSDPTILLSKVVGYYENRVMGKEIPPQFSQKVLAVILNIIMGTEEQTTNLHLIDFMCKKYEYYYTRQSTTYNYTQLLNDIISIIHTAVLALKITTNNRNLINRLCEVTNMHIKKFNVDPEALNMVSALALTFGKNFSERLEEFWPFILQGLQMINEPAAFKSALTCIGDLGRVFESGFIEKGGVVLNTLFKYVNQNFMGRSERLSTLYCIGDLILGLKQYGEGFIDTVLQICDLCFNAAMNLQNSPQERQYYDELKDAIIDMYACLVFALNNEKPNEKMFNNFPNVAFFVVKTCNRSSNPTVNYLKNCLYVLYDSAQFYWKNPGYRQKVQQVLESTPVQDLVDMLKNIKNRSDLVDLIEYINQRNRI